MTTLRLRTILAALDGYVGSAPLVTLAAGRVVVTVADLRWLAGIALDVIEARAVAEHGARAAA